MVLYSSCGKCDFLSGFLGPSGVVRQTILLRVNNIDIFTVLTYSRLKSRFRWLLFKVITRVLGTALLARRLNIVIKTQFFGFLRGCLTVLNPLKKKQKPFIYGTRITVRKNVYFYRPLILYHSISFRKCSNSFGN